MAAASNAVLCRYAEIALKGANRFRFEGCLVTAIRRTVGKECELRFVRERGRVVLMRRDRQPFSPADEQLLRERLADVLGLVSFSLGVMVAPELAAIETAALELFAGAHAAARARRPEGVLTFRVRSRRSNKSFPWRSQQIESRLGAEIQRQYPNLKVDLNHGELTVAIEVRDKLAFVWSGETAAPGGLPAGSSGRVLTLLSGGIDSPVASWMMMRRGCPVDFLTFHSHPYTPPETLAKVTKIVRQLNRFQAPGRLFACNLLAAQKEIRDRCSERFRTVLYRRLMLRVATQLAPGLGARALVTGESVGQVASQTVPNLAAIDAATEMLVLRPLIGTGKDETIALARRIGTLVISEVQCADSCTVFAPVSPTTKAPVGLLLREEARLDQAALLRGCLAAVTELDLETGTERPYPVGGGAAAPPPEPTV